MQRKKQLLLIILLSLVSITTTAQKDGNIDEWIQKGFTALEKEQFQDAVSYFDLIKGKFEKEKQIGDQYCVSLSALALCYYEMGNYSNAVKYGTKAMDSYHTLYGEKHPDYAKSLSDLSIYYKSIGSFSEAIEYGIKAAEVKRNILGKSHPEYAESLSILAILYSHIENYTKAIEYESNAKDIYYENYGEYNIDYALSLSCLSIYHSALGEYTKAIDYAIKALDIKKTILGEQHSEYATSLNNLAHLYAKLGDFSKAIEYGVKSLEIRKVVLGENHPDYFDSLNNIVSYYYQLGNYSKAMEYVTKSVNICKTTYGENHPKCVIPLNSLSLLYSAKGDYAKAIEIGINVKEIILNTYGEDHPDYAIVLNNLALQYSALGEYQKAIEYGIKSLKIHEVAHGNNHVEYATALSNLALYYSKLGNYVKAIEYTTIALNVFKSNLGKKNINYATLLNNLSSYLNDIGDFNKAREYALNALKIMEEVLGENNPILATTLNNLSVSYLKLGDYVKCIDYLEKATDLIRNCFGERHKLFATSLNNLACCYSKVGYYDKAIEYESKVIEIRNELLGDKHPDYALSLNNLADFYSRNNDFIKALEFGVKSMELFKVTLGENHPNYAMSLQNLALNYYDLGDYTNATIFFQQGLGINKDIILLQTACLPYNQRSMLWNKYSSGFTDFLPLINYKSNLQTASNLFNLSALFAKGLLLTTEIEINRLIKESGDEVALKMYEDLRIQKLQLQKLYETPISERSVNVDSLVKVTSQLEKQLVERSKVYGDFTKKLRTTWQDVQNALSPDEIAVEFLSFNVLDTDSIMVAALTLRKDDTEPKYISLFELSQLNDVTDKDNFLCPEVTDLVWKPIQNELQGIQRIYFSPAGVLHKIGIEYLPDMERYEMYRLSTTREIIEIKEETASSNNDKIMAVLYGGVNYDKAEASTENLPFNTTKDVVNIESSPQVAISLHRAFVDSLNIRGMTAEYLPSTLTEVQNICTSLKKANCPTIIHVGTDATETSVKALSTNSPTILHISTHGFYFSEKQAKKEDRPRFLGVENERSTNFEDKTLTRSGLLLAGANRSLKGEDVPIDADDGILTAQEISQLDLRGTNLVVLSACDTGKGDIIQGEGVFGLQRGFKKAGVKTIMMSLWKVNDFPTEILMTEFYKNICEGKSKRESLRLAQKRVREYKDSEGNYLFQDPNYWAGFILLD